MGAHSTASKTPVQDSYADVQVELTAMIFDRVIPNVFLGGISMVLATAALARHYHDPRIWWLTFAMLILWIGRLAIVLSFPASQLGQMSIKAAKRWELIYGYYTVLYMCAMSASTLLSIRAPDNIHFAYCVFGTFTFCNAIGARLGMRPPLALLQSTVMIAGLIVAVLHSHAVMMRWSALLLLTYTYTYWESIKMKFEINVEQIRSRRKQRDLAEHDMLTDLANRRHFERRLIQLCEETNPFAVFFLDLDGFKQVNDTHGHATGDALLQQVAHRLREIVRASDLVSRFGGDEFAILQSHPATRATAETLAAEILRTISAPYRIEEIELCIGTSIGIEMSAAGQNHPKLLLRNADAALYAVKQAGKGDICFGDTLPADPPGTQAPSQRKGEQSSGLAQDRRNGVGELLVGVG